MDLLDLVVAEVAPIFYIFLRKAAFYLYCLCVKLLQGSCSLMSMLAISIQLSKNTISSFKLISQSIY